jgi:hypothetical protein
MIKNSGNDNKGEGQDKKTDESSSSKYTVVPKRRVKPFQVIWGVVSFCTMFTKTRPHGFSSTTSVVNPVPAFLYSMGNNAKPDSLGGAYVPALFRK